MMKKTALILGVATLGGYFIKRHLDNVRAMRYSCVLNKHESWVLMINNHYLVIAFCNKIHKSLIDLGRKIKSLESFGNVGESLDMAQFDKIDFAKCGLIKFTQNAEYYARFIAQVALMTNHLQKIHEILEAKEKWLDEICESYSNADSSESQSNTDSSESQSKADSSESSGKSNVKSTKDLSMQTKDEIKDEIIALIAQMQRIYALITEDFVENDKWCESKCIEAKKILQSFGKSSESSDNLNDLRESSTDSSATK